MDESEGAELPEEQGDDLSKILRHITEFPFSTRKDKNKARELANSKPTRQFLDAGLRLIIEQFAKVEQVSEDEEAPPFFAWLSQKRVVDEVQKTPDGKTVTSAQFRDRWKYQPYYIADLLAYSLWEQHWSLHVATADGSYDLLTGSTDFVDAIHEVAYRDLCVLLDDPVYRISLIAAALAERNSPIASAIHETYRILGESWAALYTATLEARGLRLRPDVSMVEFTNMLTALAEGIGMRMISEPNTEVIDHEHRRSLLGKAALALAASCVDLGDGQKLEDVVRLMSDQ